MKLSLDDILRVVTAAEKARLINEHGEEIRAAVRLAIAEGMEPETAMISGASELHKLLIHEPLAAAREQLERRAAEVHELLELEDDASASPKTQEGALAFWHRALYRSEN